MVKKLLGFQQMTQFSYIIMILLAFISGFDSQEFIFTYGPRLGFIFFFFLIFIYSFGCTGS